MKFPKAETEGFSDFRGGRDLTNASKYLFCEKKINCPFSWLSYRNLPFLSPPVLSNTSPYHKGRYGWEALRTPYHKRRQGEGAPLLSIRSAKTRFALIKQFSTNAPETGGASRYKLKEEEITSLRQCCPGYCRFRFRKRRSAVPRRPARQPWPPPFPSSWPFSRPSSSAPSSPW